MSKKTENILITGGAGLVGTRLLPRLVAAGHDCRVLLRSGKTAAAVLTAVSGDLLDADTLAGAVTGITTIIHLAAVFRSPDADLIWKSNLEGTRNLIDVAKRYAPGVRFIMAGTAHVYNSNQPHPGREDDEVAPQHAYPASKAAAEELLKESGLNWSVIRFPFVYGDGDGHLEELPKHVVQWHPAKRMSTIHHRDIFTALAIALEGKFDRRIVNIADESPTSIFELLGLIGIQFRFSAEPLNDPWHLQVDASLARSLGFQPIVRTVYQAVQEGLL
ncbi:NAD(P)-dependent oxidoreductase [Mucilaginibacter gynuensis]|uniref:NAD(P)-dependent oxidoreductase n=1 Tax=Mucilaginibacter gynuensis TaxID=1302236 RepID=A0ABP8FX64_9SPHI